MSTGSTVLQSGVVTPQHLCAWTADGIIQDAGITFANTYGSFVSTILGVNFNLANSDNAIQIPLPTSYTRYRIENILISGANANLSTATVGVFTSTGGSGTPVVSGGTAVTVTQTAVDTVNNMQNLPLNNQNTMALSDTVLYVRIGSAAGLVATANISIYYKPMP